MKIENRVLTIEVVLMIHLWDTLCVQNSWSDTLAVTGAISFALLGIYKWYKFGR